MGDRSEDARYLRDLAARLRSLAIDEPALADQLHEIANEADDRAEALEDGQVPF